MNAKKLTDKIRALAKKPELKAVPIIKRVADGYMTNALQYSLSPMIVEACHQKLFAGPAFDDVRSLLLGNPSRAAATLAAFLEDRGFSEAGVDLGRFAAAIEAATKQPKAERELIGLTPNEQAVFEMLPDEPMPGPDVVAKLARAGIITIDASALNKMCKRKPMKDRGVRIRKGAGYYKIPVTHMITIR